MKLINFIFLGVLGLVCFLLFSLFSDGEPEVVSHDAGRNESSIAGSHDEVYGNAGDDVPALKNTRNDNYDLTNYNRSEEMLENLSYSNFENERRGNIGSMVSADDDTYSPVIENPGSIGKKVSAEDDTHEPVIENPGSIGEFIDPDDDSHTPVITNPGSIGEPIEIGIDFVPAGS